MKLSSPNGRQVRKFTFANALDGTTTVIHYFDDFTGQVLIEGREADIGDVPLKLIPIEALLAFAHYVERRKRKASPNTPGQVTSRTILDALVGNMTAEELRAATYLTPTHFNRRMDHLIENKQVHRWTDNNTMMYRVNDQEVTRILQPNDQPIEGEQR